MNAPIIVFRADASLDIGTGHVMRCLTLADALRKRGASCKFICREHPGNLLALIRQHGHQAHALPIEPTVSNESLTEYSAWLGADWMTDAQQIIAGIGSAPVDWLIVDHYALDARWESRLRSVCRRLMVIDDLADRPHDCDLLLDQTLGRGREDYRAWVPTSCRLLCGSQYALLRPEFSALRAYSLQRRANPQLRKLLISMGGVDKDNATGQVLEALRACPLPARCQITVVMGATAPWLAEVSRQVQSMPWVTRVMVGVGDMARLMADSDLAIGAAGATSWERCCLGLPTVVLVLADNQNKVAQELARTGAVCLLNNPAQITEYLPALLSGLITSPVRRSTMSRIAATIVDAGGVEDVLDHLESMQ